MNMRTSKVFGELGRFEQVRHGFFRSASGRIHLLGGGQAGGKGDGILYLDHARTTSAVTGYEVPRSLVLCDDFPAIAHQPLSAPQPIAGLDTDRLNELFRTIEGLRFQRALAIRSSAQVEDQIGQTAAGKFATRFHARPLDTEESKRQFIENLLAVYNSAYSETAARYWQRRGFAEISPLSIVIQEVVGNEWNYAPRYFLPAVSGLVNTSSRKIVRVNTVLGLGLSAVEGEGAGILHKLPILEDSLHVHHNSNEYSGELNTQNVYCLDLDSGRVVQLHDQTTQELFPEEFMEKLGWNFPGIPMHLSHLALTFERLFGFPVDIEWARKEEAEINLVQIRPINKRPAITKPKVTPEDTLLESKDVTGYGEKIFDHLIYIDAPNGNVPIEDLESLARKYPKSLILLATEVTEEHTKSLIHQEVLPRVGSLVVYDLASHLRGTGMSHLALNLADESKMLMWTDKPPSPSLLEGAEIVERVKPRFSKGTELIVYNFKRPIRVAADDDIDLGIVYLG